MNEELVSIIVPVFNTEKYLSQCLDSIISQTYPNTEIILIDDGSTDQSGKICNQYARMHSNIIFVHKDNGGVSSARNVGIERASGEYIIFIDSDDFVDRNLIQNLYAAIRENGSDLSLCNYAKVDEIGNVIAKTDTAIREYKSGEEALNWLNQEHYWTYVVPFAKLIRKEVFCEIRFSEGIIHEDELIAHRLYLNCRQVASIPDCLYFYRRTPDSIMSNLYSINHTDAMIAFYCRYKDYKCRGYKSLLRKTVDHARRMELKINQFDIKTNDDMVRVKLMTGMYRKMVLDMGIKAGIKNIAVAIAPRLLGFIKHF